MRLKKSRGFTLIELLIVVAIVAILSAVAIPKYGELIEKANLGATIGNLSSLRASVSIYYGTHMKFPGSINPADEPSFGEVLHGDVPFVKATRPADHSPYGNDVEVGTVPGGSPTASGEGWYYDSAEGHVYINSVETDIKGIIYSTY